MKARTRRPVIALGLIALLFTGFEVATRLERGAIAAQSPIVASDSAIAHRVDRAQLMDDVRTLSSNQFDGRRTASPGGVKARAWIAAAFLSIGLQPAGTSGFTEPFAFTHHSIRGLVTSGRQYTTEYKDAANLLGTLRGSIADAPYIVVSAHYDHLGNDGVHVFPGADDNASGVATLLAAARWFAAHPPRHPFLFAAFDAEEEGLKGSQTFVASGLLPAARMAIDVNMDMVSRNPHNEIFAAGTYQTPWLKPVLQEVQRRSGVKILLGHDRPIHKAGGVEDWTDLSDQGAFHDAHVPFLYFGVEDHADYHQPTDTADKIDPRFFGDVADMIVETLVTLDQQIH
jgi:Zn-dependent M28 family amino/carboxypeptidase